MANFSVHQLRHADGTGSPVTSSEALRRLELWLGHMDQPDPLDAASADRFHQTPSYPGRKTGRVFEVSIRDLQRQARDRGWDFWRGVLVGFASGFPLAYAAVTGEALLRVT